MLKSFESCKTSIVLVITATLVMLLAGSPASAQAATPAFAAADLAGVSAIVVAFLAVGAAITIAMTLYRKGRQGAGKV